MAVGPIPMSEIVAYLDLIELRDPDERFRYVTMIAALDDEWLSHQNRVSETKAKSKPPRVAKR